MNVSLTSGTARRLTEIEGAKSALLQNNSGSDIYLGPATVTADTADTGGYKLADGKEVTLNNGGGSDPLITPIFAIQGSGSTKKLTIIVL